MRSRHSSSRRNDSRIGKRISFAGAARGFERQTSQNLVEVVAADVREAGAGHHGVSVVLHFDQGRVEGAAAEVINQHRPSRLTLALRALAMAELDAGRGGLVEHAQHLEAGRAKSLRRQKPLIAVGIGRHADHDFDGLAAFERERRCLAQLLAESRQHLRHQFHYRHGAAGEIQPRGGSGPFQQPLQRAKYRPSAIALHSPRAPAVAAFITADGHQGREPFPRLSRPAIQNRPADSYPGPPLPPL